eukprot:s178_g1.t1
MVVGRLHSSRDDHAGLRHATGTTSLAQAGRFSEKNFTWFDLMKLCEHSISWLCISAVSDSARFRKFDSSTWPGQGTLRVIICLSWSIVASVRDSALELHGGLSTKVRSHHRNHHQRGKGAQGDDPVDPVEGGHQLTVADIQGKNSFNDEVSTGTWEAVAVVVSFRDRKLRNTAVMRVKSRVVRVVIKPTCLELESPSVGDVFISMFEFTSSV